MCHHVTRAESERLREGLYESESRREGSLDEEEPNEEDPRPTSEPVPTPS